MSRSPDQIRREIEQTRSQLAQHLEAIGDRVSPKHVKEQVAEKVAEMTDKVNPRHILNRQVENVKESLASAGDSIIGRTAESASGVRGALQGVKGGTFQAASAGGGSVAEQARRLRDRSRSLSTDVAAQVRSAPDTTPMATAFLAFGAGLVVGLALPPTGKERQVAGMLREQVVEPAKDHAAEASKAVAAELQPAARAKAERVKRTVSGAVDRVKRETKGVTDEVQGQAQAAAAQVKGQAKRASETTQKQAKSAASTTKKAATRSAGQVRKRASV